MTTKECIKELEALRKSIVIEAERLAFMPLYERNRIQALELAIKELQSPSFLDEALNSGDGNYRP